MAYKQTPGRGNRAKTGHGLPSPFKQDYNRADKSELEGNTRGATGAADVILKNYPAQGKHLRSNVQKDEKGNISSYTVNPNSRLAVEQVQVAKDSMAYLGNTKDPKAREKAGREFSFNFSPNSKYGKKAIERQGGEYQGPNKVSSAPGAKRKVLQELEGEAIRSRTISDEDTPQKRFGIGKVPEAPKTNPKSGATKKSPMKQMETINKVVSKAKEIGGKIVKGIKTMDKALEGKSDTRSFNAKDTVLGRKATGARAGEKASPAKMKVSKKTAYDIKEASNQKLKPSARKNYAENAQAAMKNKKTPAKMKKC